MGFAEKSKEDWGYQVSLDNPFTNFHPTSKGHAIFVRFRDDLGLVLRQERTSVATTTRRLRLR